MYPALFWERSLFLFVVLYLLVLKGVVSRGWFPLCCRFISEELFRDLLSSTGYISGMCGGEWSSGKYVEATCLRAVGSSPAPPAVCVGILASYMAYGVVRQGFDPGLQVFLCQQ
jgi:hypothetical protein